MQNSPSPQQDPNKPQGTGTFEVPSQFNPEGVYAIRFKEERWENRGEYVEELCVLYDQLSGQAFEISPYNTNEWAIDGYGSVLQPFNRVSMLEGVLEATDTASTCEEFHIKSFVAEKLTAEQSVIMRDKLREVFESKARYKQAILDLMVTGKREQITFPAQSPSVMELDGFEIIMPDEPKSEESST